MRLAGAVLALAVLAGAAAAQEAAQDRASPAREAAQDGAAPAREAAQDQAPVAGAAQEGGAAQDATGEAPPATGSSDPAPPATGATAEGLPAVELPGRQAAATGALGLSFGEPVVPDGSAVPTPLPSPLVIVDPERLFGESAWGRRVQQEYEARAAEIAAEDRRISDDLVTEERRLTDLRPEMDPEEFSALATEFDARVQRLRAEQGARAEALASFVAGERERFFAVAETVLVDVVQERGAVAIIDRASIVLSIVSLDITDAAIARIDAELGDGSQP